MNTVLDIVSFITVWGLGIIFVIGFGAFFFRTIFIICEGEVTKTLFNFRKKFDHSIVVGSTWGNNRYEIVKIIKEYQEPENEIERNYRTKSDKVIMIYLEDIKSRSINKYELSEFKKWFKK